MRIVDLSLPICEEVTPVPGHPNTRREPIMTPGHPHLANTLLTHSLHVGTHVDAPKHFYPDGLSIDKVDLNRLIGKTYFLDVHTFVNPGQAITLSDLQRAGLPDAAAVRGNRILVFANWCARNWNRGPLYGGQPYLHADLAIWLVDAGLAAFAADFPVDGGPPWPNHLALLGAGIPLIENLINLDLIDRMVVTLWALPLKMKDDNGGPARVIAVLD